MSPSRLARAVVALGLFVLTCCARSAPQADLRPIPNQNVLLITIDTLRADALGCYGGPAATPALDSLAAQGVRFDFAHAHAVTTLASHASILTGTYPFQHGIRDNSGYRLPPNTATAASVLKARGYRTAAFVGAFPLHSRFGLNQGFDSYLVGDVRATYRMNDHITAALGVDNIGNEKYFLFHPFPQRTVVAELKWTL